MTEEEKEAAELVDGLSQGQIIAIMSLIHTEAGLEALENNARRRMSEIADVLKG